MKMKEKRNEYEIEQKKRIFCTPKNTQHTKEKSSQEISTQPIIISIITRWTFFRVKLVFEFEFDISWSLGPWDLGTP